MKISQILQQLKKSNPQLADKYDDKHLLSVVEEQLFLRDYKNNFKDELSENSITDDEEDEIELKPEEIPIEEPEEEIPTEEPELEEPEIQDEPQTKNEPETEQEPEIPKKSDDEGEIEINPEELPSDRAEPKVTVSKTEPEDKLFLKKPEGDGYIRISPTEARELLSYKGKIFTAIFTKRSDGSLRSLNGMTGVRKYTSGGELPYSPKEKELIPVYDLKKGPGKQGYRTIPLEGLKALKINGKKYKIDQTLNEIIVNKPVVSLEDVKSLKNILIKDLGVFSLSKEEMKIARSLGWKEDGNTTTKYFENNKHLIPQLYSKLRKLKQDNIQEIGNLQKTHYIQSQDEEVNIQEFNFEVDGRKVELKLSLELSTFKDELNIILGNQTPPKNIGEVGFTVDNQFDTTKSRNKWIQTLPTKEKLEQRLQTLENDPIIKNAKRLGYNGRLSRERNRDIENLINKNIKLFNSYNSIKQQLSNFKQLKQEIPKTKEYINILNKVSYVIKDILEKYKLNLLILNKPGEVNKEITTKRNNIYTQLIKKHIPSGYEIKEKNQILYIQKTNNLQENMKKTVLKQLIKEVLLEVKASKKILKEEDEDDEKNKKRKKTNFNFKSTFEDLVIKINESKPTEFNSLKQEWLKRLESSRINPATNKKMVMDVKKIPNHAALIRYANNSLLRYEGLSLNEDKPAPQHSPQRQSPDREVIEKPETDTPERKPKRRTLTPPTESPITAPKAEGVIKENDKQIANKIADRFKKLK